MSNLFVSEVYIVQSGEDMFHLENIRAFTDPTKATEFANKIDDGKGVVYIEVVSLYD